MTYAKREELSRFLMYYNNYDLDWYATLSDSQLWAIYYKQLEKNEGLKYYDQMTFDDVVKEKKKCL